MEKNTVKRVTKAMKNVDIIALLKGEKAPNGSTIDELIAHLEHENELLARKNAGDTKKLTKVQQENEGHKKDILNFLQNQSKGVTATEVMVAVGLSSNQKATALLNALCNSGQVVKVIEKGKSLFSIAQEEI